MALRLGSRRDVTRDIDVAYDEHAVIATGAEQEAAGVKAVMESLRRALSMGPFRTAASLVRLNQRKGFDCLYQSLVRSFGTNNTPVSKGIIIRLESAWGG